MQYKYSPEELYQLTLDTIQKKIFHKNYARTVKYAELCHQIMTGDSQTELLVRYHPRETNEQKDQRVTLYNSRTQFLGGRLEKTASEIERVDNAVEVIKYDTDQANKVEELYTRTKVFFEGDDLKKYLFQRFRYYNFYDPNAYLIIEGTKYDLTKEKPYAYPFEVISAEAVNMEYLNGILQFLITCVQIDIIEREEKNGQVIETLRKGKKYTAYGTSVAYVFQELNQKGIPDVPDGMDLITLTIDKKPVRFGFASYQTMFDVVPAVRFGYIPDPTTRNQTCVAFHYAAEKLFLDIIRDKNEYDLHKTLHGFLQKYAYGDPCDFIAEKGNDRCRYGKLADGSSCPSCAGTGIKLHLSVQDIILVRKPDGKDEHIPLRDYVHYVEVPTHIIQAYKEDLKTNEIDVARAIFNADIFTREQVATTATAKRLEKESVYNTLAPYGEKLSGVYEFAIKVIASMLEIDKGLTVEHRFPYDLQIETVDELMTMRKTAIDAGAPYEVIRDLDKKILFKMNRDNPAHVEKIMAREAHKPFKEKREGDISSIIGLLLDDSPDKVLWMYFSEIFDNIENDLDAKPFYKLPWPEQKLVLAEAVQKKIDQVKTQAQQTPQAPEITE